MTRSTNTNSLDLISIVVKQDRRVILPSLPKFIRDEDDTAISIENLTEEQLREIGKQWTDALVHKASAKRHNFIKALNKKFQDKEEVET